ncbi:unnamed protein product [Gordionus sp. m RMFG-2023]
MDKGKILLPVLSSGAIVLCAALYMFYNYCKCKEKSEKINVLSLFPEEKKVVNVFDIEDLAKDNAFCRCWRSKIFPYCDGSHNEHNQNSCDNVGPLIIKKSQ